MTLTRHTLIILALVALLATPAFSQSSSAKTQAVFTASQMEERCAASFKQYERFKEGGRLLELEGSIPRQVGIVAKLGSELDMALTNYLKAIDSGWKASDAELTKARETIQAMQARMEKVGVWTCFQWDEKRLPDADRASFDRIRLKAWEGTLLVKVGRIDEAAKAFAFARELIEEHGEAIDRRLDAGTDVVDTRKHPAYARTVAEVDRLQATVKSELDKVQGARDRLEQDVAALAAAAEKAAPALREFQNMRGYSGTEDAIVDSITDFRKKLDAFESGQGPEVRKAIEAFTSKYGADRDAIQASITRIMGGKALEVPQSPQFLIEQLNRGLNAAAEGRKTMVEELLAIGRRNSKNDNPDAARRKAAFDMARRCLQMAVEIDPGNAEATSLLDGLGAGAAAADAEADAALDQGTWDDHSKGFQGPGNADSLAESALEWLDANDDWTKDKDILAVRVNGDWLVAERDKEGRPVTWGLPIEAAFIRHSDKEADRDAAWVYRLTMVTRENEKSPPWKMARVGSNRQMRASKIDAADSGGPNPVFQLVLGLALIASGVLLIGPFVT
jgi:tetratricopeptide (TPR) repeat protein